MFDSIVKAAQEKLNLGGKADALLAALLALLTDQKSGGFAGFLERFRRAGAGPAVDSWIAAGESEPLSDTQVRAALGEETLAALAEKSNLSESKTVPALGLMIPRVVDELTPQGEVPDEASLSERLGGFLAGFGGAAVSGTGAARAAAGNVVDRPNGAAGVSDGAGKEVFVRRDGIDTSPGAVAGAIDDDGSILRYLIPLILLGIVVTLGYWFCTRPNVPLATVPNANLNRNANANLNRANANATARTVDASFRLEAREGRYFASGAVPDQTTFDRIKAALAAQFGEANVDVSGLRVEAGARPFAAGWWDNFSKLLPSLKDWKTGTLAFAGSAVTTATGLPQAALEALRSLFAAGWTLPVSVAGAETAARQANEEALRELNEADSVDEVIEALNLSIINFASGKSDIPADARPILDKAAEVLKRQPAGTVIEIGGHTDTDGNDDANLRLSQARAEAVKKALVGLGVADAMLAAKGYGETAPVAPNDTDDNKFKNRRIEYQKSDGTTPAAANANTNAATNANTNAAR